MIEEFSKVTHTTRYRFTDQDGKIYAPFRVRPGATISQVIAAAFPDEAHDTDWKLDRA